MVSAISRQRSKSCSSPLRARGRAQLVGVDQAANRQGQRNVAGPRGLVEQLQGGVAEAALRLVHDALEGEVVGRLLDDAQVSQRVADFQALVEARAAHHPVRQAERDEALLELAGLRAGAHQDGDLLEVVVLVAGDQRLDLLADEAGLGLAVPKPAQSDLLALLVFGPQRLAEPALIVGDEARGGGEDAPGGTVVALQTDHLGAGKVLLEAQDVADLRAAPAVDRLVVVADAADVLVTLCEQAQPEILRHVGVLVLVDEDEAEAPMIVGQHFRLVLEDRQVVQQQVAEVAGVERAQAFLVGLVEFHRAPAREIPGLARRNAFRGQAAVLPALDDRQHGPRRPFLLVDVLGPQQLLDQADLVVGIEDGEVALETDGFRVAPQDTRGDGMEGAEPPALHRGAVEQRRNAVLHLARRLVGEGHSEDLAGRARLAGDQQVGEARGQYPGLAGAGAGQHQHRAVERLDRLALARVEGVQIGREPACLRGRRLRVALGGRREIRHALYIAQPAGRLTR